ncbi:MAG: lysine--tRNA ligase [Bacteroidetes bacterium]|nr:lysine--tRNA ligase [Bacteroidota bacterium]
MERSLSEQEEIRRSALKELINLGYEPYPAEMFETNAFAVDVTSQFGDDKSKFQQVKMAGRLMSKRIMGKASFAELMDSSGRIQIYVNRDEICPDEDKELYNVIFKKHLDIGDFIGIEGYVFLTKVGEITIHVSSLKVLCKSVRPLPVVKTDEEGNIHDGFTDPEQRYRQRYVDLVVNPEVKETFLKRTKLISTMRTFLSDRSYVEVETPILQPIYGGAAARPFKTHHNTLDMTLYLRIANELYLKKLIVGGFEGVFEFAKDFRNEGMSRFHNPEFTQMELYVAYKDYIWMMELVEEMLENIALELHGTSKFQVVENEIDFKRPLKRLTMYEAIQEFTGEDISELDEEGLRKVAKKWDVLLEEMKFLVNFRYILIKLFL